jgi:hypothetical protein
VEHSNKYADLILQSFYEDKIIDRLFKKNSLILNRDDFIANLTPKSFGHAILKAFNPLNAVDKVADLNPLAAESDGDKDWNFFSVDKMSELWIEGCATHKKSMKASWLDVATKEGIKTR